jgi:hypothetical protein
VVIPFEKHGRAAKVERARSVDFFLPVATEFAIALLDHLQRILIGQRRQGTVAAWYARHSDGVQPSWVGRRRQRGLPMR